MKETVIIDLAILEHDTEHCPVCSRLLTMSRLCIVIRIRMDVVLHI